MKKLIDKTKPKRKIDSKTITNGLGAEEIKKGTLPQNEVYLKRFWVHDACQRSKRLKGEL